MSGLNEGIEQAFECTREGFYYMCRQFLNGPIQLIPPVCRDTRYSFPEPLKEAFIMLEGLVEPLLDICVTGQSRHLAFYGKRCARGRRACACPDYRIKVFFFLDYLIKLI